MTDFLPSDLNQLMLSHLPLEELIAHASKKKVLKKDFSYLTSDLNAVISQYIDTLRKNNVPLLSRPGDAPYIVLEKTINGLLRERQVLLIHLEITPAEKIHLRNVFPEDNNFSIENIIDLNSVIDKLNVQYANQELERYGTVHSQVVLRALTRLSKNTIIQLQQLKQLQDLCLLGKIHTLSESFSELKNLRKLNIISGNYEFGGKLIFFSPMMIQNILHILSMPIKIIYTFFFFTLTSMIIPLIFMLTPILFLPTALQSSSLMSPIILVITIPGFIVSKAFFDYSDQPLIRAHYKIDLLLNSIFSPILTLHHSHLPASLAPLFWQTGNYQLWFELKIESARYQVNHSLQSAIHTAILLPGNCFTVLKNTTKFVSKIFQKAEPAQNIPSQQEASAANSSNTTASDKNTTVNISARTSSEKPQETLPKTAQPLIFSLGSSSSSSPDFNERSIKAPIALAMTP